MPVGIGSLAALVQRPQVSVVARFGDELPETPVTVELGTSPVVEWRLVDRLTGAPLVISGTGRVEFSRRASLMDPPPVPATKTEDDGLVVVTSREGGVVQASFDTDEATVVGTTSYRLDVVDTGTRTAVAKGPFVVAV